ncbi:delayed-early response protein/equilibrative nucleoside transporter [Chelativorans sp. ZYF759]|nr:delayed-early response protein/equilibrative nucleoside transporter [Chelativorans sp. ZYF759]
MRGTTTGALCLAVCGLILAAATGQALAQSPLGIGATEAALPTTGLFGGWLAWINVQQQGFYRTLTTALRTMRDEGTGAWMLVSISFAYGVFHAAGPGHGKAVISSYMLANEVALRRGVLLSFLSSLLQAVTAIVVMSAVFLFLRGTAFSMADATRYLEVASYALVTAFGAWLLWRKAFPRLKALFWGAPVRSLSAAVATGHASHAHEQGGHHHDHHHGPDEVCSTCGHSHAPDPRLISGDRFDWKTAWAAIVAVGVRPCTGALVVLSFAFLNGLWISGIVSVFAMAIGTALTVSVLATLAVMAKNWAVAIGGDGRAGNRIHAGIEISGAALVFLLGLTLLLAALSA